MKYVSKIAPIICSIFILFQNPLCIYCSAKDTHTFTMYENNWKFPNGYWESNRLLPEYRKSLFLNLRNTEKVGARQALSYPHAGECYGMSVTSALSCYDLIDYTSYNNNQNASSLYEIANANPENVSLITYYQTLQLKDEVRQYSIRQLYENTQDEMLQYLVSCAEKQSPTVLAIDGQELYLSERKPFAHSVLAYDIEYGRYSYQNKEYNGKILIYDNANPYMIPYADKEKIQDEFNKFCLYFNTDDWNWYIPYYQIGSDEESQGHISLVSDNINLLNTGGFIQGTESYQEKQEFLNIFTSNALNSEYAFTDESRNVPAGMKLLGDYYLDSSINTENNFILPVGSSDSYTLQLSEAQELNTAMYYENSMLKAYAENAEQVSVSPESVSIHENTGNYKLEMVCNEGYYSGSWYEITVSGSAKTAEILKEEKGYLLSADNLKDVKVKVRNDTDISFLNLDAEIFSADDLEHILFSETRNGILSASDLAESLSLGDLDGNQIVNAKDAALILMASANVGAGNASGITGTQEMAADINFDEKFNAVDAALILQYSASAGSGSFSGTLTEFIESK